MRLLLATPDPATLELLRSLLAAALELVPLQVSADSTNNVETLLQRVALHEDDVILLDWQLAGAESPNLVRAVFAKYPRARVVALLPDRLRQYRQRIWEAGACSSIPMERLDQEWLSSALCIMSRAMAREAVGASCAA
ncbi:MAG: response regulator transcription factor [Oscillochloris sp.]|nr:response regulator transcription factor [Oscillochloris sp.]